MKKKMKIKYKNIVLLLCFIIIPIIIKVNFSDKLKIVGTWTTDNVTTYVFHKNNTGKLIVSLSEYKFKYNIKKNIIYIDFDNNKSEDLKFEYKLVNKKLILSNEKGVFNFIKKDK